MRRKLIIAAIVGIVSAGTLLVLTQRRHESPPEDGQTVGSSVRAPIGTPASVKPAAYAKTDGAEKTIPDSAGSDEESAANTPEELREEAEEAAVEAFDNLTDKWMEPAERGVKMSDVDAFVAQFAKVPAARKEECLQRALNLVPDENVMLLAGVLMDKNQPKELVELVFNDVLNRDEGVKKPILGQIFKDKTHPCWADTAWILDVTGETPHQEGTKTAH